MDTIGSHFREAQVHGGDLGLSDRRLTAEVFRDVIGRFASGVTVVTTSLDGVIHGATASAVSSLSLDPPMLLVCMNRQSTTGQAVLSARRFAINILGENQPDLAVRFASRNHDKFAGVDTQSGVGNVPLLSDALATIECRVVEEVMGGTHTVFIAEVDSAVAHSGTPLAYFRGKFGRISFEQDDAAVRELRSRVIHREVPVGEVLDLETIARELNVPRGSVYHALATLTAEGHVDRTAQGDFIVPAVTLSTLLDAVPAMYVIWLGALQLTIGRATSTQHAELRRLLTPLANPSDKSWTSTRFIEARSEFFHYFLGLTESTCVLEAWARADVPALIAMHWSGDGSPEIADYERIYQGFTEVLDAYELRDTAAASSAIVRLESFVLDLFRQTFEKRTHI